MDSWEEGEGGRIFVWSDLLLFGGEGDSIEGAYSEQVDHNFSGIGLCGGLGFELHYKYI